jgi:hypothetical protein
MADSLVLNVAFLREWLARDQLEILKRHQQSGVLFMLSNLLQNRGCVLADHMGLGKTLQVLTLCDLYSRIVHHVVNTTIHDRIPHPSSGTLLRNFQHIQYSNTQQLSQHPRVLLLAPAIVMSSWRQQIHRFFPRQQLHCPTWFQYDSPTPAHLLTVITDNWAQLGGVLFLSYKMFLLRQRLIANLMTSNSVSPPASFRVISLQ